MHFTAADEYALKLNFSVSHNQAADQLMLNGMQIYPVDRQLGPLTQALTAPQMVKSGKTEEVVAAERQLGYSMAIHHPATSKQDHLDLVSIHIKILQVADKFIDGLPSVDLKILETPSGKLMIGDVQISVAKAVSTKTMDVGQECTTILCKWKAIIAEKASKFKGCGRKVRPAAHAVSRPRPHGGYRRPRPHGGRPHGFHRHHNRPSFVGFLKSLAIHIFVPIFIGVVVGITASLVGMVMGHVAIFIWRSLFRRGETCQYFLVQEESVTVQNSGDKMKNLVETQGPPPVYEEAIDEKTSQ